MKLLLSLILLTGLFYSCEETSVIETPVSTANLNLPQIPYAYANQPLPAYLNAPLITAQINNAAANPTTDHGATLGRVLFYDKGLSANGTVSCASCHQQSAAFSDPAKFSKGFNGGLTTRNSMSLLNARYYPNGRFFWDERSISAEAQASRPIVHPVEMGMTMKGAVEKIKSKSFYPALYKNAFGTEEIDSARTVKAIAQFVRSIISYRTKYDEGRAALAAGQNPGTTDFSNYTASENLGKRLFFTRANCGACHGSETFSAPGARNNGLDLVFADNGVGAVTNNPPQNGQFKVPSLKGIEKSAPYMHDGRFATLREVVEHYNSGVKNHPNLSPPLRLPGPGGGVLRLNLTETEITALVDFMKTLTDTGIENDPKFSDPFISGN